MFKKLSIVAAAALLAVSPAYAADGWEMNQGPDYCGASSSWTDGTEVYIMSQGTDQIAYSIANRKWKTIVHDRTYTLDLKLDEEEWTISARGIRFDNGLFGLIWVSPLENSEGDSLPADMAIARFMRASVGDALLTIIPLDGSYKATLAVNSCARRLHLSPDYVPDIR